MSLLAELEHKDMLGAINMPLLTELDLHPITQAITHRQDLRPQLRMIYEVLIEFPQSLRR